MNEAFLNIAGIIIRVKSKESLKIGKRSQFAKFVVVKKPPKINMDLTLCRKDQYAEFAPKIFFEVKRKTNKIPSRRPAFISRSNGRFRCIGQDIDWRVGESNGRILLEGGSSTDYQALLDKDLSAGECFIISADKDTGIFNGTHELLKILFLYYITKNKLGIMAHSAGIDCDGGGYLFAGPHASGKSTIARLWDRYAKAGIASDENIVIKRHGNGFCMHSTPWHGEFSDFKNSIDRIRLKKVLFIYHWKGNTARRISRKDSFNLFFQSVFLFFWDKDCVDFTSRSILAIVSTTPCHRLGFKKDDGSIVDYVKSLK